MQKTKHNSYLWFTVILIFLTLLGLSQSVFALSPPWYLLRAQLQASLEADPCVRVGKLTGEGRNMEVAIKVCEYKKAQALATLISKKHAYGDKLLLTVNVFSADKIVQAGNAPTSIDQAMQLLKTALEGNQFFVKVGPNLYADRGFVEFKPLVVQYFSDDISDWYRNTNLVASQSFKQLLDLNAWTTAGIFIRTTTSRIGS